TAPAVVYSGVSLDDGTWRIDGIPGALGYTVRYSKTDYVTQVTFDAGVIAGTVASRGTVTLPIPRLTLTGNATFVDKGSGQHGGIVISDASGVHTTVTGPNGFFSLGGLAATASSTYQLTARSPGYVANPFSVVGPGLTPDTTVDVGSVVLQ